MKYYLGILWPTDGRGHGGRRNKNRSKPILNSFARLMKPSLTFGHNPQARRTPVSPFKRLSFMGFYGIPSWSTFFNIPSRLQPHLSFFSSLLLPSFFFPPSSNLPTTYKVHNMAAGQSSLVPGSVMEEKMDNPTLSKDNKSLPCPLHLQQYTGTIAPAPDLTATKTAKYEELLAAVKEWQGIPSTIGKGGLIMDHEIMWLTKDCLLVGTLHLSLSHELYILLY